MEPPRSPLSKRILYKLCKWCKLTPYDIEQALRNRYWNGIRIGTEKYVGHCYHHPEEPLQETGHGYYVCPLCRDQEKVFPDTDKTSTFPAMRYIQRQRADVAMQDTMTSRAINYQRVQEDA